ncbi:P-loop containing nucleoside triphosphate hydrolase protein [Fimicolochytrium jonesii]|uniref:P-loop containing nucleoside triphosphate hydrolase protein n=1 Tax=Fimicolochytrium jonesii TaxID=1396493 RepID=UPI0022FDCEAB|nr:P-loop containing nucleoside triphosphate hydrolase protein [Fimicolochytrium jonesii]KAI8818472.1 P-loop containing nucleoside triphosphate hydrolase protein [Fimicolochytrium jonesii]
MANSKQLTEQNQKDAAAIAAISSMASPTSQRVLVAVRIRPPTIDRKSPQKFATNLTYDPTASCITYTPSTVAIQWPSKAPASPASAMSPTSPSRGASAVTSPTPAGGANKTDPKKFNFDSVLGYEEGQGVVYEKVVEPLIRKCLEGYNGCVFCYGQTASGKTYTMEGPKKGPSLEPPTDPSDADTGIIMRVASQIMQHVADAAKSKDKEKAELEYFIKASYLEIYQEGLTDLLVGRDEQGDLKIRQDPESTTGRDLYISGITERSVTSVQEFSKVMQIGGRHRTVGETNMNEVSSRSHAVLTIIIEERRKTHAGMSSEEAAMLAKHGKKRSKIHLIDLAGSERANATGATGDRLKEGSAINQSLSCLGNVINALTTSTKHVPYRDSKLTYLLSDSLGGNSLTLMITCVTPTLVNYDESLSTLRFAERVKKVKNAAKVNVDATMMRIMMLEAEIRELRAALSQCKCGAASQLGGRASTTDKVPWWRRVFGCGCAAGGGGTARSGGKVAPVERGIVSSRGEDQGSETVLKSVKGKLSFA